MRSMKILHRLSSGLSATNQKKPPSEDDWSEDEAEIPSVVIDAMLTATDFLGEWQYVLNVAPGEGNTPLIAFKR